MTSEEQPKCDFCSSKHVTWSYPCRDFIHRPQKKLRRYVPDFGSKGGWAACDRCHALIEGDDWPQLAEISARTHPQHHVVPMRFLRPLVRGLHKDFAANQTGPAIHIMTTLRRT